MTPCVQIWYSHSWMLRYEIVYLLMITLDSSKVYAFFVLCFLFASSMHNRLCTLYIQHLSQHNGNDEGRHEHWSCVFRNLIFFCFLHRYSWFDGNNRFYLSEEYAHEHGNIISKHIYFRMVVFFPDVTCKSEWGNCFRHINTL